MGKHRHASPTTITTCCVAQTDRRAAGNTTLAQINYRVLGPWLVTDPNLNRSGVRYDALGMVVTTALMGKLLPDGDRRGRSPRHEHPRNLAQRRPHHAP